MSIFRGVMAATLIVLTTGCASGLNSFQESELASYRANNLAVEEKSPGLAAGLGILPGGGSFYGRAYGYGVLNLLLWPASIFWDPVSGYSAVEAINYQASKAHVASLRNRDMSALDSQLASEEIDMKRYSLEKNKLDAKYLHNR